TREAGMNFDRFVLSPEAALTTAQLDALPNSGVTPTAPKVDTAVGSASLDTVTVTFTRPLAPGSVNAGEFVGDKSLQVTAATLDVDDPRIAHLTTTSQTQGTVYTLTVSGVTDTGGTPIAP